MVSHGKKVAGKPRTGRSTSRVLLLVLQGVLALVLPQQLGRTRRFEVLPSAHDWAEAVCLTHQLRPDVLAVDLALCSGEIATRLTQLQKRFRSTRVLVFNAPIDHGALRMALARGVSGYLTWDASLSELVDALQLVATGQMAWSSSARRLIQERYFGQPQGAGRIRIARLSRRESEVAQEVIDGKRSKEIAEVLGLSLRTVEKHRANIKKKAETWT